MVLKQGFPQVTVRMQPPAIPARVSSGRTSVSVERRSFLELFFMAPSFLES